MVERDKKEWTLMFFFAGDNTLAPSIISQLKAIKDAGFHKGTNVLVRFDPNEKGAPTRVFEVNRKRKLGRFKTKIGDGGDPFVRNLSEDVLTGKDIKELTKELLEADVKGFDMKQAISLIDEVEGAADKMEATNALDNFLRFCRTGYPAKHYMLFLVGHGMIVGNDAFLPDDNPDTAITLQKLGEILGDFTMGIGDGSALELVGLHSCSMSGVEVAYQLKGKANYMMATEGISFVGSWPYRQLLKKIFNSVEHSNGNRANGEEAAELNGGPAEEDAEGSALKAIKSDRGDAKSVKMLLTKLHYLCLHNSTDFMFAGFSADLQLCNLNPVKVEALDKPLRDLTRALKAGLHDKRGKELILLAHWKSQSYFQENYTDLYDFCRCLKEECQDDIKVKRAGEETGIQRSIRNACRKVMVVLRPSWKKGTSVKKPDPFDALVVYSDHFGPTYQYSHGLSIYFPWAMPVEDQVSRHVGGDARKNGTEQREEPVNGEGTITKQPMGTVLERYAEYEFSQRLGKDDSWLSFLKEYFKQTKRQARNVEDGEGPTNQTRERSLKREVGVAGHLLAQVGTLAVSSNGQGDSLEGKPSPSLPGKTSPSDSGGVACSCGTIKNYPIEFSSSRGVWQRRRR
jgi:hypothetical protein